MQLDNTTSVDTFPMDEFFFKNHIQEAYFFHLVHFLSYFSFWVYSNESFLVVGKHRKSASGIFENACLFHMILSEVRWPVKPMFEQLKRLVRSHRYRLVRQAALVVPLVH